MKIKILIVEDDTDLGNLLKLYLEFNGFDVHRVNNGREARKALKVDVYNIVVLDVTMPVENGFSVAEHIAEAHPSLPFIFVTARKMKEDVLKGLKLGADDYIVKPFDADELILRIQNILKRTEKEPVNRNQQISIGRYEFNPAELTLISASGEQLLTEKEAQLLLYLWERKGQLIKRESILDELWREVDYFNGRSMDVFISKLRKYLSGDPNIHIKSIRSIGYRFRIDN